MKTKLGTKHKNLYHCSCAQTGLDGSSIPDGPATSNQSHPILFSFEHLELSVLLSEMLLRAVKYLLSLIDVSMPFDGVSNMILA
jgi:hypothetical protein